MMEEVEGIVLGCIEGVERLICNDYQFTISNKSQLLSAYKETMQEKINRMLVTEASQGFIMSEKTEITFMQTRLIRLASEELEQVVIDFFIKNPLFCDNL